MHDSETPAPATRTRRWLVGLVLLAAVAGPFPLVAQSAPPSPEQVLGYGVGERFTDHANVLRYMDTLAGAAPGMVRVERYGETPEGRALVQVVIARADYLQRLDEILDRNRQLADPATPAARAREIAATNPAVIYYSYGVHGNESSSSEAALWTAWDLVRGASDLAGVLDSAIVVIDPVANPDGRDRYVNWYRQARGATPNPNPETREHWEPWPGGRFNHYLFDLNRDWAWATQPETRARLATWDRWTPQVHVDFHEMGFGTNYFFFPAATPINPMYPAHILDWGRYFGDANARAFDQRGWTYYTGEGFDLFYPGYGDSWPSLLGTIGMTYEQAGSGRAGLTVRQPDGQILTLTQRATQHRTSGNATLYAAAARRHALLSDFARFYQTMGEGVSDIVIVPGDAGRARALLELLQRQGIRVEQAARPFRADATPHHGFRARRDFPAGSYLVRARQPRGRLAATLLQPETVLDASYSYDISAWSLPFAYGVEAHSLRRTPDAAWIAAARPPRVGGTAPAETAFGMLAPPGFENWPTVIRYLQNGGRVRVLNEAFSIDGRDWPAGTLFFPRVGVENFAERIRAAGVHEIAVPVSTGRATTGSDLGTGGSYNIKLPRVALISGEGVAPTSLGAHWFFLEQTLQIPFDQLPPDRIASINLGDYDVIITPDMGRTALGERGNDAIRQWVQRGGTLISTGSAARGLGATIADVKLREDPKPDEPTRLARALQGREERRLERWESQVAGAILSVQLDPAHPLAFGAGIDGQPTRLFVLHSGAQVFEPDVEFETVGHFQGELQRVSGVIGERSLQRLQQGSWLIVKRMGSGRAILFIDDPVYRHFWYSTFQTYANAIMVGPAL
jgi:ribosomal protein L34